MNNAIAAHEVLPAENPDNRKMLLDDPFKMIDVQPKETDKETDKYFRIGFTQDIEQALDSTLNDKKTFQKVKSVVLDK